MMRSLGHCRHAALSIALVATALYTGIAKADPPLDKDPAVGYAQAQLQGEVAPTQKGGKAGPGSAQLEKIESLTPGLRQNIEAIDTGRTIALLGKQVLGSGGEKIGLLTDVIVNRDGFPYAAVIDFGGFLGVGSRRIAVDWKLLTFKPGDRTAPVRLDLKRADLAGVPEYKGSAHLAEMITAPDATLEGR
jgi:hypothetical protein